MAEPEDPVARARTYPYPRHAKSFLFVNGSSYLLENAWAGVESLSQLTVKDAAVAHEPGAVRQIAQDAVVSRHGLDLKKYISSNAWTPILAIGSNASALQLARKYDSHYNGLEPGHVVIPVVQAVLEDFDVVYAPSLAPYGSCPATLEYSPGTAVEVFITFLTAPLAALMHETEFPVYVLARLNQVRLHLDTSLTAHQAAHANGNGHGPAPTSSTSCGKGAVWTDALCYQFSKGSLVLPVEGAPGISYSPVAIAEIPAAGRTFPALTQPQLLHTLRRALAQPAPLHPVAMAAVAGGRSGSSPALAALAGASVPAPAATARATVSSLSAAVAMEVDGPVANGTGGWSAAADGVVYTASGEGEESADEASELDAWLLRVIGSAQLRRSLKQRMQAHAAAEFRYPKPLVELVQAMACDNKHESIQPRSGKKATKQAGGGTSGNTSHKPTTKGMQETPAAAAGNTQQTVQQAEVQDVHAPAPTKKKRQGGAQNKGHVGKNATAGRASKAATAQAAPTNGKADPVTKDASEANELHTKAKPTPKPKGKLKAGSKAKPKVIGSILGKRQQPSNMVEGGQDGSGSGAVGVGTKRPRVGGM